MAAMLLLALLALATPAARADPGGRVDRLLERAEHLASFKERRADLAVPLYREAVAIAERAGDRRRASRAWSGLGAALVNTHQPEEARAALERGRRLARAAGDNELEARALGWLGVMLMETGDYDDARAALLDLLAIGERTHDAGVRVRARNSLSGAYRKQGLLPEAEEQARRALAELERAAAAKQAVPQQALFSVPYNLGAALAQGGDYAGAMDHFNRALEAAEKTGNIAGKWHVLQDSAYWYLAQGDLGPALRYFERALQQSRLMESEDPRGLTLRGLGLAAEARGETGQALASFAEALALFERIGHRSELPQTLTCLSRAQWNAGLRGEARASLGRALALASSLDQPLARVAAHIEGARQEQEEGRLHDAAAGYEAAVGIARRHAIRPLEAVALAGRAEVERLGGDLPSARRAYEKAVEAVERIRGQVPSVELRASFAGASHRTHLGLFETLMEAHRRDPAAAHAADALLALERERMQNLALAVGSRRARGSAPERVEEERRLHGLVASLQTELNSAEIGAARRAQLAARLDDAERDLDALEGRLARREIWSVPSSLGPSQESLEGDEAFVAYAAGHGRLAAFVLTRSTLRVVEVPLLEDLGTRIDFFLRLLGSRDPKAALPSGVSLAQAILAPALDLVSPATRRLIVSASGELAALPFAALPDPDRPGQPLLARFEVGYVPALSALAYLRQRPRAPNVSGVFAAGGPEPAADLPWSRSEVERLRRSFRPRAAVLAGSAATEAAVKTRRLADFELLHFSSHALVDPEVPSRSSILLGAGAGEDGRLQPREIHPLDLNAELVVLSACETASGRPSGAEGTHSLARAFHYAGARSVVGTLWKVEDAATARLVADLYRGIASGATVATALRAAQLKAAGPRPYAVARDWAGFVVMGDPGARPRIETAPFVPAWLWACASILFAAGAGYVLLRRAAARGSGPADAKLSAVRHGASVREDGRTGPAAARPRRTADQRGSGIQ
jgi:CHAT domain-containing protein